MKDIYADQILNTDRLRHLVKEGYVRSAPHPHDEHLRIYNYTQKAQYEGEWNEVTLACRGLILHRGQVVARPFPKFFNLDQLSTIPEGDPVLHEKLDGSLGIGYIDVDGNASIATRGSFTSDQALWATEWLRERPVLTEWVLGVIGDGITPMFEIIYPGNRIVVEYGDRAELVFLGAIHIEQGCDVGGLKWPGESAQPSTLTRADLEGTDIRNEEGYVLTWPCGTRAKYKFPNYVRLHKIITGVNERRIWEILSSGARIEDLMDAVPDEFHKWVKGVISDLSTRYLNIYRDALEVRHSASTLPDRKTQAEYIKAHSAHPGIVFGMLDDHRVADKIWKLIKPESTTAYWSVDDPLDDVTNV